MAFGNALGNSIVSALSSPSSQRSKPVNEAEDKQLDAASDEAAKPLLAGNSDAWEEQVARAKQDNSIEGLNGDLDEIGGLSTDRSVESQRSGESISEWNARRAKPMFADLASEMNAIDAQIMRDEFELAKFSAIIEAKNRAANSPAWELDGLGALLYGPNGGMDVVSAAANLGITPDSIPNLGDQSSLDVAIANALNQSSGLGYDKDSIYLTFSPFGSFDDRLASAMYQIGDGHDYATYSNIFDQVYSGAEALNITDEIIVGSDRARIRALASDEYIAAVASDEANRWGGNMALSFAKGEGPLARSTFDDLIINDTGAPAFLRGQTSAARTGETLAVLSLFAPGVTSVFKGLGALGKMASSAYSRVLSRSAHSTGINRLVHLAPVESAAKILQSRTLGLPSDIYAGPASNAKLQGWGLSLKTGLNPHVKYSPIHIPNAAESAFKSPTAIGPFTFWQKMNGTRYTPRGTINLDTGQFVKTGINWSQVQWQATDLAIGAGVIIGAEGYFNGND